MNTRSAVLSALSVCSSLLFVTACGGRYLGWEQVRVEGQIPSESCVFKAQEACSKAGADCYNFWKQRATTYGANTVVPSNLRDGQASAVSGAATGYGYGYVGGSSQPVMYGLADYYTCPIR